jgi:hypothetical protein
MRWLGGIYSLPTTSSHWLISAGDGHTRQSGVPPNSHCALFGARHVSATVRVWSSGPLERLVVLLHRTVRCPLTSALWLLSWHCSFCRELLARRESLLCWLTGQSGGTPDSSVNYSEAHPWNSREWLVHLLYGLVHRTLSGAPKISTVWFFAPVLIVSLTGFSFLVCVECNAPVIDNI